MEPRISREQLKKLREQYPAGTKVRLLRMDDPQAPPIGSCGTVTGVDDTGSLLVNWEKGGSLNALWGIDEAEKVTDDVDSNPLK